MQIRYELSNKADDQFHTALHRLAAEDEVSRICEIGGGANPALPLDFVREHGLKYTIVDVSRAELEKAPDGYEKVHADIADPNHEIPGEYDLVFSKWCAEHVRDGQVFHRRVYDLLARGGRALHLFPTLFAPPFLVNRLIPEWLSSRVLLLLQPHRDPEGDHGKFPAFYSWCRGPSSPQLRRLEGLGYRVHEYAAFFGHSGEVAYGSGYLDRIPPLRICHEWLARQLVRRPLSYLTTFAYVILGKGQSG